MDVRHVKMLEFSHVFGAEIKKVIEKVNIYCNSELY